MQNDNHVQATHPEGETENREAELTGEETQAATQNENAAAAATEAVTAESDAPAPTQETPKEKAPQSAATAKEESKQASSEDDDQDESDDSDEDETQGKSFEELLEEYDQFKEYSPGDVITGQVVSINEKEVLLDIGARVEGAIPTSELMGTDGNLKVKEGDEIEAMVCRFNPDAQNIPLSHERARVSKVWDYIEEVAERGVRIQGTIIEKVKGGFIVDVGVRAFLPTSLSTLKPQKDYQGLLGQSQDFDIVKIQRRRGNIILSRKDILQKEYEDGRTRLLSTLAEGDVIDGKVKNITDYGAFIDLGGLDGLLHITDMSWGRVNHPKELLEVNQPINVKVLRLDKENEKVSLGLKQCTPDPWLSAGEKYPPGKNVKGKVLNLTTFGAFVELEPGVEGLIHVSEMSWTKKIRNPKQVLNEGDELEVSVLDLDSEARKVSLSLRQVEDNPWDSLAARFPVGSRVHGKVRNITDFGAFIEIEEGIDGLVHVSDFKWGERAANPRDFVKKGEEIEVVVLAVDTENHKVSLGIKQKEPDPWIEFTKNTKEGTTITTPITRVTDFGVFVRITDHVEGLIRNNELELDRSQKAADVYKEGDTMTAVVTRISNRERKVDLSVRRHHQDQERKAIQEYNRANSSGGATMADVMRHLVKSPEDNQS